MLITLLAALQLAVNRGEARSFLLIVGLLVFYYSGASWWLRRKNSPDAIHAPVSPLLATHFSN
jgi:hypothetical protein